jgi:hypothetical protein
MSNETPSIIGVMRFFMVLSGVIGIYASSQRSS